MNREEAERLAIAVANFLEDKSFAKNPHISLIGPGTRTAEMDTFELLSEVVEEQTEQWLSPYVTGFRVNLRPSAQDIRTVKVNFSFALRVAPPDIRSGAPSDSPDKFRQVDLCAVIKNESECSTSLTVYDGDRQKILYSKEIDTGLSDGQLRVNVPEGAFDDAGEVLRTATEVGYGSEMCSGLHFVYSFSLAIGLTRVSEQILELMVRLADGGGCFVDANGRTVPVDNTNERCRRQGLVDELGKPWSVGQLFEVNSILTVNNYDIMARPTEYGISGLHTTNCVYNIDQILNGEIRFTDYAISPERGRELKASTRSINEFISWVLQTYASRLQIDPTVASQLAVSLAEALARLIEHSSRLYTFQEDCTIKVLDSFLANNIPCSAVPMSVQTAGGKTLAFLIPLSMVAFSMKSKDSHGGVKAMLFYPTKALINDQADTILKLLWSLNSGLRRQGYNGKLVTFGVLHGDTPERRRFRRRLMRTESHAATTPLSEESRLKCPLCGSLVLIEYSRVGDSGVKDAVRCSGTEDPNCPLKTNEQSIHMLNEMIRATQEAVYSDPPDILVCTPDMINVRLFFDPTQQTVLGRSVKRCVQCGYVTANLAERKPCVFCGNPLEGPIQLSSPKIIVFDEAHQLRGSFGSQVSYVMSRFEEAVKSLTHNAEYHPVYIFSSATLGKPTQFIKDFFGRNVPTKDLVKADFEQGAQVINRIHLFMVPKGFSPEATLIQSIKSAFKYFPIAERHPNVLIFVNSLAEANEILHLLKHYVSSFSEGRGHLPPPVIDGHSTDYGTKQRIRAEDSFTRGNINILVATRTLEVGIDFDRIDVLVVYGAPFYLSEFVQRIGRAGRKHAALIINILPDKPIDFYFFENYMVITDTQIRERALVAEAVRLSRENETVRRRSAVRALFDYLCTRTDAPRYYKVAQGTRGVELLLKALFAPEIATRTEAMQHVARRESLNPQLIQYIERALKSEISNTEMQSILRTVNEILEMMMSRGVVSLGDVVREGRFMSRIAGYDLRQSDSVVQVEHPDLVTLANILNEDPEETQRERALGIAIGDYAPGQITSYRSLFFVVQDVQADPSRSSAVRSAILRRDDYARRDDL